jgi:acetyl-CoA carboxylase biotin carboxyl carrier protein
MEPQQIKAFIDAMAASDLAEMEISHDGWTLRLVRHAGMGSGGSEAAQAPGAIAPETARSAAVATPAQPAGDIGAQEVRAPMFGVLHLQQAPGEPPFVKPGDRIEAGQMLCTIEAMKVFNELRAECAGRVSAVLVASGTEVEAGQPLMTIERVQHV